MARVETVLVPPGVHMAPQGPLHARPTRLKRWAEQFARMKAAGIRVPCSWGHQPAAVPGDPDQRAKQQYWLGAYNAGYVDNLRIDPTTGALRAGLDVPGCEMEDGKLVAWRELGDGTRVKTAVGEVSAAIKDWKDGTGKVWPDSIIHVALTPLPVVAGQRGFKALGTASGTDEPVYLSLMTLSGESTMFDEEEDKVDETDDAEDEAIAEGAAEGAAKGEEEAELPDAAAGGSGERINEVIRILEAHGLHLPPDTTLDNIVERICVAGHAKGKGEGEDEEGGTEDEFGEDEGASYDGTGGGITQEEQRPVMMSLSTAETEREKKLLARQQQQHKTSLKAKIAALRKRGLPPHVAEQWEARLEGYTLSLTADLDVHPKALDRELALADSLLPKGKPPHKRGAMREEPRPQTYQSTRKSQEEAGEELAALAGVPVKKK